MPAAPPVTKDRVRSTTGWVLPLTLATAILTLALFVLALRGGWLGPAIGRGGEFCEAARDGLVKQPANTVSNLGFVVAGLAVAARIRSRGPGAMALALAGAYAVIVVLLGPASAAMHATESELGGHLDLTSMFLISSFALAYAVARLRHLGAAGFGLGFAILLGLSEIVEFQGWSVPVLMTMSNLVFLLAILATLAVESHLTWRRGQGLDLRWGLTAVGALAVAFGIWNVSKDGGPWCDTHSLLQGHAAWHLLCAVAAYALFRAYAAASPASAGPPSPSPSPSPSPEKHEHAKTT